MAMRDVAPITPVSPSTTSSRAWFNLEDSTKSTAKPRRKLCFALIAVLATAVLCATLAAVMGGGAAEKLDPRYWYGGWSADDDDDDNDNPIVRLKAEIHKLNASEVAARFGKILPKVKTPSRQQKIDHVVVLYMENHAADHYFGCMGLKGFDSVVGHTFPKDPSNPSEGNVEITCGTANYVCRSGPGYDTFASKFGPGGNPHIYPYSNQSDRYSALHGAAHSGLTAVRMFSPEQVPIK